MILFSDTITSRLSYIAGFIGKEISGQPIYVTDNKKEFEAFRGVKINYSAKEFDEAVFAVSPHPLLFEKDIKEQNIVCSRWNGLKVFFPAKGDIPFDIFAASFFLVSRYEEYLPHAKDMYGRYAHENSTAFRHDFLNVPLINQWLMAFSAQLKQTFPLWEPKHAEFTFLPTYDIDEAFSYRHKQGWRFLGATVKDMLSGNWKRIGIRNKVRSGFLPDPFDSYGWMDELHRQHQLKPNYFFLVAEKNSRHDKNILPAALAMQKLIQQHAGKYNIGLHPSWQSGDDKELLGKEKDSLEKISGASITSSRQHFIRLNLPETYRRLVEAGIQEEFSMGYGSINGFRASVASPFYWYDLEKEEATSLLIYPFCYMEANSFFEQKLSPPRALEEMRYYYSVVKNVNGLFITVWHNTFLGTDTLYKGWREIYQQFIGEIGT